MSEFDDIRPYDDSEVEAALARVLQSDELIRAITRLRFPRAIGWFGWLLCPLVRYVLSRRARKIHNVRQVQEVVGELMEGMIEKQVSALTVSGLDKLDSNRAYLFISNHRDIAMDPAFVNFVLNMQGWDTVRIAIGDNLLTKPYVSDLIRLNKSFIVKRSAPTPREKLKASKHLSNYVRHSIVDDRCHTWIAQREGRAKDGRDATNAAIISMLALSRDKTAPYADHIRSLNIVPVAISYEWDPCDTAKANEVYMVRELGKYAKGEHEDVASIAKGIAGEKGAVHVAFGEVLTGDYENAEQVAADLDRQVWSNYVLHPSNLLAYEQLSGKTAEFPCGAKARDFHAADHAAAREKLLARVQSVPAEQRDILLRMYANPVISKLQG